MLQPPPHAARLIPWPHLLTRPPLSQVNYNLLAVNAFMAITGIYQLQRKIRWDMGHPEGSVAVAETAAAVDKAA